MIHGVKDGSSLRPTVTADMLSSHFIEQKRRRIYNSNNHFSFNNTDFDDFSNINDHSSLEYPSNPSTESSTDSSKVMPYNPKDSTESSTDSSKVMPYNPKYSSESQPHNLNSDLQNFQKQEKDIIIDKKKNLEKKNRTINKTIISTKPRLAVQSLLEKDTKKSPILNSQKIKKDLFSVKGKNQSDKINSDLLISRNRNTISLNQQQDYFSKNMDIEIESIYRNILQRLKKSEILKTTSESSITVNVGKITVRAVNDNNYSQSSAVNNNNNNNNNSKEPGKSNKLSLNDYLRKRAEKI